MRQYKTYIVWSLFVLFLGFSIPLASFYLVETALKTPRENSLIYAPKTTMANTISATSKNSVISLVFVGDIMLGRGVEKSIQENNQSSFSFLFDKTEFLKKADLAFGNLEGPIAASGQDAGGLYSFRFNPIAFDALAKAGFDAFSIANNHAADWGREAFEENIFRLKNENILAVGGGANSADATSVKIIEKNGIKIGLLGFSDVGPNWFKAGESQGGISIVDDNFPKLVQEASRQVDILVISLHFGEEYQKNPSERQKYLARTAIDNGAKIVIGHHPHVIQKIENYNGGVIAYSLGNFIFDQNFSEETMEGLALEIYLDGRNIAAVKPIKVKLNDLYQPGVINN